MRSMTGFGRGQSAFEGCGIVAEVRSWNGRQRELRFKLPPELSDREALFRSQVQERVSRGRVEVFLGLDRAAGRPSRLRVNRDVARCLAREAEDLRKELGLAGALDLGTLIAAPGVVEIAPAEGGDAEGLAGAASCALREALDAHARSREAEGERLREDLRGRLEAIAARRSAMAGRAPEEVARLAERLRRRVLDLAGASAVDEARFAQEVAYLAERSDIAEELVRLASHVAEAEQALAAPAADAVGRRLEFLLQEILREANTIASKTGDLGIGRDALEIKIEVEKAREQVQNVE